VPKDPLAPISFILKHPSSPEYFTCTTQNPRLPHRIEPIWFSEPSESRWQTQSLGPFNRVLEIQEIAAEKRRRSEEHEKKGPRASSRKLPPKKKKSDGMFLKGGPEELTKLHKPLGINISKRREYTKRSC
jgi:hypothetical protein